MDAESLKERAIDEARRGLLGPWLEDRRSIQVNRITGGLSNYIFEMTHLPSHERIIVRFYGSALTGKGNKYKKLTEKEELAIMNKLSEDGLVPRTLFAFDGGRIEAFVAGRLITLQEITERSTNDIIANKLAHIHSMQGMLERKDPLFDKHILFNFLDDFERQRSEQINDLSESDREIRKNILQFDARSEAKWIASLLESVSSRIVFSHNDVHMKNIFVLEEGGDLLLMDYEYSGYNYRWADLANHLCEISMHSFDLPTGQCIVPPVKREEKKHFLHVYLTEWIKLKKQQSAVDTVDNLMLEVDFGFLVVHLMRVVFFAAYISTNHGPLQSWAYTKVRLERYLQSKEEFIANYGQNAAHDCLKM